MNQAIQIIQTVGHLLWFSLPIFFAYMAGEVEGNDRGSAALISILLQATIVAGYLNGWNVR